MGSSEAAGSTVERVYEELKSLAISYAIKPGTRLNEGEVARRLGVSRTPLREALNRLTAAGFLAFAPHHGFFSKPLDPAEIVDLYEMRVAIETASVRLAARRATAGALDELEAFLAVSTRSTSEDGIDQLVRFDEGFHERIVKLTGNRQMLACLSNVNERIRFFRWIDLEDEARMDTQEEHRQVLLALRARDGERAASLLDSHIGRRRDQIVAQVREGYARIYESGESARSVTNGLS